MEDLNDVMEFLDTIPNINKGGCGIAAYAAYLWLKKEGKPLKKFRFIFLYKEYDKKESKVNREILKGKSTRIPNAPSHMIIQYDGQYWDSELLEGRSLSSYPYRITVKPEREDFIRDCLKNEWTWNSDFKRHKWVSKIEKKLKIKIF